MVGWSQGESIRSLGPLPFAAAACFALSATMLTTFPILAPHVVSELKLSYVGAGLITSAYMFGYGLFQIPASLLVPSRVAGTSFANTENITGIWISPPPPTTASTNPAKKAAQPSITKSIIKYA